MFRPILMHFAARYSGHTYGEFASDYKTLVKCNLKALDDFDIDMVGLISDPYRETSAFGAPVEFVAEGVPRCRAVIVKNEEDVKNLKNPDVYKSARTLDRIKGAKLFQKELKGEVPVIGWIEGPLAEAANLAGVGEILTLLMMNPDMCNLLMDKCMITAKDFAKAQVENGCRVIGIGDAVCSQLDPSLYDIFVKERHKELISYIHSLGATVKLHICGNITHLLPFLASVNTDILDIDWQVDPLEAKKIMGAKVILCGNINPVTIQDSTVDEILTISKNLIKRMKDTRFILSGGCEITVNTPAENLKAMREAAG